MKSLTGYFIILAITALFVMCKNKEKSNTDISAPAGWKLVWADEFNYSGLPDSNSWDYDIGGHGWGNNEKQYYTKARTENARVENGMLIIEARQETMDTNKYTSARLITKGKNEWTYGRFEARAKLPKGLGTWPAIWMLAVEQNYGDSYWPHNGEIDIMEHVGYNQGFIHASTHTLKYYHGIGTQRTDTIFSKDVSENFHIYSMEWGPDTIKVFFDDRLYFTSTNDHTDWEAWPFDKPFYLLLNIAVGGNWGGAKGVDPSIWPQRMEVDYVRVFERSI